MSNLRTSKDFPLQRTKETIKPLSNVQVRHCGVLYFVKEIAHTEWEDRNTRKKCYTYIVHFYSGTSVRAADSRFCELVEADPDELRIIDIFKGTTWYPPETAPKNGSFFGRIISNGIHQTVLMSHSPERGWFYLDFNSAGHRYSDEVEDFQLVEWSYM